jgi:DNA-binding XRE family transcriptional regulator
MTTKKDLKQNVSNNAKYIREQLKLTQAQLADLLNIKRATVGAFEDGRSMGIEVAIIYCEFTKVSLDTFYKTNMSLPSVPEEIGSTIGNDIKQ